MKRLLLPLTLGLAHCLSDGAAGLLLGSLPRTMALTQVGLLVLLYNGLAFGGQPLAGLLVDRLQRPRAATLLAMALMAAALLALPYQATGAVLLAGLASALFHVAGGALALAATAGRAAGPGLFAAPGVVGLALGGALAVTQPLLLWPFLLLLLLLGIALALLEMPALPYQEPGTPFHLDDHDLLMVSLLAAIALRSAIWSSLQFLMAGEGEVLLALALAAAAGKMLGGVLADWLGWRRWVTGALLLAAPLLSLGGQRLLPLLLGVALLQSATPVALAVSAQLLPRRPATAAGLALGLAIALGGLPVYDGLAPQIGTPPGLLLLTLAAALALWWALRRAYAPQAKGA